ncbi:MAG: MFS transporter [Thermoleophilia bacterium]|nr:MFS transporter [Thermoleophilia bacterium]
MSGGSHEKGPARQNLWTRSFIIIWVVNFLSAVCFLLLMIVMSKVATDRFDASPAVAGLSASIFVIGAFVTRPSLGKQIHRIGQNRTLYIGSILSVVLTLAYFAVNSIEILLLVRFLHGAAHGTAALAVGTIVAGAVPRERYGEGIGYFTLGQTLSTAIGPAVGLVLLRYGGFNPIIITCSVAAAIGLVLLPFLGIKDLELTAEQVAETRGFKLSNYVEPKAVPISLALMVLFLCYSSVSSFLALYSEVIELTTAAGLFFLVYAAVIFVTRPYVGRRFDERGENSVVYAAILVFAVGLALLAAANHSSVLLLAAAVMGLGFGAIQACGRALIAKVTPLHRMGQATSTFYIFGDTGLGLGPLICGFLISLAGYRGMYGVMAGVAVVALVVYHLLHGRRAGRVAAGRPAAS